MTTTKTTTTTMTMTMTMTIITTTTTTYYSVSHKKRATLFWTITSVYLDEFLHFLYQWKQE